MKGNAVLVQIKHEKDASREAPEGFSGEEMLYMKKGNIVCKEGEIGDSLYYISSGRYSVWHRDKIVGTLDPSDIFMGEMSFFLNNERSATVIAETDGIMIKVPRKNFIDIIKKYPQYGLFLSKLLSRKLARANIASAELQSGLASAKTSV
jgi:CRP-like cAMP-binding protein